MNPILTLPGRPVIFLAWFAAISALLLPGWEWLSQPYAQALVWLVNIAGHGGGLSDSLQLKASGVHGAIGSAFVAAVALFGATPGRDLRWKIRWSGLIALVLYGVHAVLLTAQVRLAHADLEAIRAAPRAFITGQAVDDGVNSIVAGDVSSAWYWLFPLLTALVWFTAMQRSPRPS